MGEHLKGLAACVFSSLFFGSMYIPVKKFDPGNGIFLQFMLAAGVWCIGLIVYAFEGFPQFYPLAMAGGAIWALGNAAAIPIMRVLGMGLAMLLWGTVNCVSGWAVGRFGLFGTKAHRPSREGLNYAGLALVVLGGCLFALIRKQDDERSEETETLPENEERPVEEGRSEEEHQQEGDATVTQQNSPNKRWRIIAFLGTTFVGTCYGLTFTPVIFIQDNPDKFPGAPTEGLNYVFSHFTGIFSMATFILILYITFTQNSPDINSKIAGPGYISGIMWGLAQASTFIANDNLSMAVSFPIICMMPGVIAAAWSVFVYGEIRGKQNLQILAAAVLCILVGATMVGLSK